MRGVAVVTGMARCAGIGHAICTALLDSGMKVIGLDKDPLECTSPLITHDNFEPLVASILDSKSVHEAVSKALKRFEERSISVVVNNAGVAHPYMQTKPSNNETPVDDSLSVVQQRLDEFDTYIDTNLRGSFLVTEVCRKWFPETGVSIVHIASTRARQSESGSHHDQAGYSAAKAGLIGLMHAQGQAMIGKARVNVISPGWIETEGYVPSREEQEWHAAGRVGRPEDVANLVVFLADEQKSGFLTCEEIVLDGGTTRKMYYPH